MKKRGLGRSISGTPFSSIHGDLITEVFNGQTKRQAGPHRSGFSTNVHAVNTRIKMPHIHAKLREIFASKIRQATPSSHKETTNGAKTLHGKHVQDLKDKLNQYLVDPFGNGVARELITGKEIDVTIIKGLVEADVIGDEKYREFVKERLVDSTEPKISLIQLRILCFLQG